MNGATGRGRVRSLAAMLVAVAVLAGCGGPIDSIDGAGFRAFEVDKPKIRLSESDAERGIELSRVELVAACFAHRLKSDLKILSPDAIISTHRESQAVGTLLLGQWADSEAALAAERGIAEGLGRPAVLDQVSEEGLDRGEAEQYLDEREQLVEEGPVDESMVLLVVSATTTVLRYTYLDADSDGLPLDPTETTNFGFQVLLTPAGQIAHFDDARCGAFDR